MDDAEPLVAAKCPNCGCPMLPPQCHACRWEDPDDDSDDDATDLYSPEVGGSD